MRKYAILLFIPLLSLVFKSYAQFEVETKTIVYKEINGAKLEMDIYRPKVLMSKMPAIVFFFGGGWVKGSPKQFELQARYLASRGIIAVCPDYRVKSRNNTTPFESVKDARSAMRYLKENAETLNIDPKRIVASGGSAGGHLAASTALLDKINEETDNPDISPSPMALVLFNPVVDTGKKGYGQSKVEGHEFEISPVHHIMAGTPPTLIMHGKRDTVVSYENVSRFKNTMKQMGNKCKLVGYKNQGHGFYSFSKSPKYFLKTLSQAEYFLDELGLLQGESWLKKYVKSVEKPLP